MSEKIFIETEKKRQVEDITDRVNAILAKLGAENGACLVFLLHTTAALATADLDPGGTDEDYLSALANLIPEPAGGFRHPHNPAHMPDHILSSLVGTSLVLPVENGKLVLGTWQRIALFEFDGPRKREIIVSVSF